MSKRKYTERQFLIHYARVVLFAAAEYRSRPMFKRERGWHATLLSWAARARQQAFQERTLFGAA